MQPSFPVCHFHAPSRTAASLFEGQWQVGSHNTNIVKDSQPEREINETGRMLKKRPRQGAIQVKKVRPRYSFSKGFVSEAVFLSTHFPMKVQVNLHAQKTTSLTYFELFPLQRFPLNLKTFSPLKISSFFFLTGIERRLFNQTYGLSIFSFLIFKFTCMSN